jgi:nicotinate phosphoribosyltransferase
LQETQLAFHTASSEEIKSTHVADVYFHRTMAVLRARGAENTPVHAELTLKSGNPDKWFVVAGLEEVAHLLEGTGVEVRAVPEGTICRPHEPLLTITGPYGEFGEHETATLGLLCQASGVATGASRCRMAAGERPVVSFGARRMHPAVTPMIERAAYIGGCDSVAVEVAAERFDIPSTGTVPHALALILGSTEAATKAFDEAIDPEVPRAILIDTFDDEKFGALLAAEAIPETIEAIRMDTPGSRRGDFADLMREVRWELDSRGFDNVKIYASGSIGVEDILHLNPYCDAYGVGSAIAAAPMVDYSLDIVEVDGERRAKRGKMTGRKKFLELRDGSRTVIPAKATPPEGAREILKPLDELYAAPPSASEIRDRVLSQLQTGNYGLDKSP